MHTRNALSLIARQLPRNDPLLSKAPRPCPPTNKEILPRLVQRPVGFLSTQTCRLGWTSNVSSAIKSALRLPIFETMPSKGKKRKMEEEAEKFYAVRAGFAPGVYREWADCQEQISGFRGAQCEYAPAERLLLRVAAPF